MKHQPFQTFSTVGRRPRQPLHRFTDDVTITVLVSYNSGCGENNSCVNITFSNTFDSFLPRGAGGGGELSCVCKSIHCIH